MVIIIKKLIGKKDIIIVIVLLVIALAVSLYNYLNVTGIGEYAHIYIEGEFVEAYELTDELQNIDIKLHSGNMQIIIIEKKVFVESSSCDSKQCIKKKV